MTEKHPRGCTWDKDKPAIFMSGVYCSGKLISALMHHLHSVYYTASEQKVKTRSQVKRAPINAAGLELARQRLVRYAITRDFFFFLLSWKCDADIHVFVLFYFLHGFHFHVKYCSRENVCKRSNVTAMCYSKLVWMSIFTSKSLDEFLSERLMNLR